MEGFVHTESGISKISEDTMEQRLRNAHTDTMESLNLLREKLRLGGILNEHDSADVRERKPCRTQLEDAVSFVEEHGSMIRELANDIVL